MNRYFDFLKRQLYLKKEKGASSIILVIMFYPSGVKGLREDLIRLWRFLLSKVKGKKGKEVSENG